MPRSRGRLFLFHLTAGGSKTWEFVRAFLILFAGTEVLLLLFAVLLDANLENFETHLILLAAASGVAALGLFMTSGDPGGRIGNAAKTLLVLLVLVGGVLALLLWAASTASRGS